MTEQTILCLLPRPQLGPQATKPLHYTRNVHFNGAGNRDHRALGTKYILKDRGDDPNYEVISTHFLEANTTIPVPTVAQDGTWTEESRHFTMVERVPGIPLEKIWSSMPQSAREELARCTAEYLGQLRSFQSETMGSVDGSPLYCGFLFPGKGNEGCQVPHGPLKTAVELWRELEKSLKMNGLDVPQAVRMRLRDRMSDPAPWTFTHSD